MSIKINKNGKEYPLGFVPQSLYDDVEDLKDEVDEIKERTLKRSSVSGTTDQYGNLVTDLSIDSVDIVGARYGTAVNGGVIPMISPDSDFWYFKCLDYSMNQRANTSLTVYFYYY